MVEQLALFAVVHPAMVFQIEDGRAVGAEDDALIAGGHEAAGPVLGAADGAALAVEHDDVAGQVLIYRAEAVVDPGANGGLAAEEVPGIHHQHRRAVNRRIGRH